MRTFVRLLAQVLFLTALTAAHAQQSPQSQPGDAAPDPPHGVYHAEGLAGGAEVALSHFRTMLTALPNLPGVAQVDKDSLTVQAPLAVYTLAEGASLDQASATNTYLYPIVDGNGAPVTNSEVGLRNGRLQVLTSNWMGPYVDALVPAIARIHGIDFLRDGSYELRLLRLPPQQCCQREWNLLWLASTTSSDDYIYMLPIRTPGHMRASALYRAADFFELAKSSFTQSHLAPVWF